jgi:hypothetical protein
MGAGLDLEARVEIVRENFLASHSEQRPRPASDDLRQLPEELGKLVMTLAVCDPSPERWQ